MIQIETATVYRGGGRRWFSKKAAIRAEANKAYQARVKDKQRCGCGGEFSDVFGQIDDYCHYHDRTQPIYSRYIRFAQYVIGKATQGEKT